MPKQKGRKAAPDYVGEARRVARENIQEVVPALDARNPDMLLKVANFAERFAFNTVDVEKEIRANVMLQAKFAKDPGKQGMHEKLASAFIESLPGVEEFETLGKNKWVVFHGAVMLRKSLKESGASNTAKTVDFKWKFKGSTFYASHKFTLQGGGMQDEQYEDIRNFITQALPSNLADTYFIAIADGDYYKGNDTGTGTSKLEALKRHTNKRNVFAMSIDELEPWLESLS